ncbi:MAG: carbon monoxide dehydrogenase, partial [bacterium]|nr:carbon monoxide dehydrogenase [bacterium]
MKKIKANTRTIDPAAQYLLKKAQEANIETGWDRFDAMQDVCGFGSLGLCCRICMMGPCRIDPFGEGPQKGICGISADAIVARNLCRMIAAGAASHSDHGAHILAVLERILAGDTKNFKVKDPLKLQNIVKEMGLEVENEDPQSLLRALVDKVKESYSNLEGDSDWLLRSIPAPRLERFKKLQVMPPAVDPTIREAMHRTHMGVDADPVNLLLGSIKCA